MKRFFAIFFLVSLIVAGSSFKMASKLRAEQFKNDGYLVAVIDGKSFEAREENKYTAELMNKSTDRNTLVAAGSKITRIATSINFYGVDYKDDDNNTFTESLGFEYTFNEGAVGEEVDSRVILSYNNQRYTSIPAETKIKVGKIEWSSDKRSFVMSGEFDAKMKAWGAPGQSGSTLHVKGRMEDITISVPSWIILKNNLPTASEPEDGR